MVPLIGLTTYNYKNKDGFPVAALTRMYISAIAESGGMPVLIPSGLDVSALDSLMERMDGILFPGGVDISIENYRGESHPGIEAADPNRDAIEIALLKSAAGSGKPFLGICRGLQMVNVALGGTLYTHLPDQMPGAIKHAYNSITERKWLAHSVKVEGSSQLARILGEKDLHVNSLHHQGVKELAPGLHPAAYAPDGLVEALELPGHPFGMAVQWHPEWLMEQAGMQRLFRAFITASSKS